MKKILVVDDSPELLRLYKEELEEVGEGEYKIITAANGKEATELFETECPDLVTLDILLPDTDGIKLLVWMKERKPHLPIIMLTAYDSHPDCGVWHSEAYIVKNSDLTELIVTIKRIFSA